MDRRLLPRPLPAHLATAGFLWLSSRAALTSLPSGWPRWNGPGRESGGPFPGLAEEIARLGPERAGAAFDRLIDGRAAAFIDGLAAYRRHPYRRAVRRVPVRWRGGAARLFDYGGSLDRTAPAVLIVPSLINRSYILNLLPERSFVRHLAAAGLRPLVLDWGEPGRLERGFSLTDYIAGPLAAALRSAAALAGRPVGLAGYCMGGLLALAAALRQPSEVACLALLATPWDFHAERPEQGRLLAALIDWLPRALAAGEPVPVPLIQSLFLALDPFLGERKFVRFAGLDPAGAAARSFVALEDWINDGVPLAYPVARDCARSWYRDNEPAAGRWRVGECTVRPEAVATPTLAVLPSRDRIVPPASAAALAEAVPGADLLHPPFGHIGMMASAAAPDAVWRPIAAWLQAQFSRRPPL